MREEKIFNQKFKRIFTAIVSNHLACNDSSNKIIDMGAEQTVHEKKKIPVDTE